MIDVQDEMGEMHSGLGGNIRAERSSSRNRLVCMFTETRQPSDLGNNPFFALLCQILEKLAKEFRIVDFFAWDLDAFPNFIVKSKYGPNHGIH